MRPMKLNVTVFALHFCTAIAGAGLLADEAHAADRSHPISATAPMTKNSLSKIIGKASTASAAAHDSSETAWKKTVSALDGLAGPAPQVTAKQAHSDAARLHRRAEKTNRKLAARLSASADTSTHTHNNNTSWDLQSAARDAEMSADTHSDAADNHNRARTSHAALANPRRPATVRLRVTHGQIQVDSWRHHTRGAVSGAASATYSAASAQQANADASNLAARAIPALRVSSPRR